jgi:hypothetical protein
MSSGRSPWTKTRAKCAAAAAAASSPWNRSTSLRARACFASRAEASAGGSSPRSSRYQPYMAVSGMRMVFPYISSGASVTPIWLPRDFDIFRSPSTPVRIGIVSATCSG